LSNELNIDEGGVAVLVDDMVTDLLTVGEKALDPVKAEVSGVVAT
jgi:hypothetical protein